eukprot:scaffold99098_cov55-Attheya_sp.AAC.4
MLLSFIEVVSDLGGKKSVTAFVWFPLPAPQRESQKINTARARLVFSRSGVPPGGYEALGLKRLMLINNYA